MSSYNFKLEQDDTEEYVFDEEQKAAENICKVLQQIKKDFEKEYNDNKDDPNMIKELNKKYSPFNIKKSTKGISNNPCLYEITNSDALAKYFTGEGMQQVVNKMFNYTIKKIKGVYKHAQALKTGFCNLKIIDGFAQANTISLCITKNTLEANEQWLERLYKDLEKRYPTCKVENKILVISSKKNTLNGNATHCKNIMSAWNILKKENDIKVIFLCSNKTQISNILEISQDFQNLTSKLQKKLIIFHDEAHNEKEGIPAYRGIIEYIIIQPNVLSYTPISASINTITHPKNPMWNKDNMEKYALNYTCFDNTLSTDSNFSSCDDATKVSFEILRNNPSWQDYNMTQIPVDIFNNAYASKNYNEEEIEEKRTLEYCQFMKNDKEIEAVNNGLNCLNMNQLLEKDDFYNTNEFNLHVMATPRRIGITRYLCLEACKKNYNPIVLGIYGSIYHLFYDGKEEDVTQFMGNGEFNSKLENLMNELKTKEIRVKRPFIIIGNYSPTGESLTFVNFKYGTVKSVMRLISTTPEEDYQTSSRENYMCTLFVEKNPNWVMPEKYLIGEQMFIDNAMSYEAENDARILIMRSRNEENKNNNVEINLSSGASLADCSSHNVAVPIRFVIDRSDPIVKEMLAIVTENTKRNDEHKKEFLRLLKKYVDSGECEFTDITGKFNFDKFKVTGGLRSYKKKENEETKERNWRFSSYQTHFKCQTPYINSNSTINVNECEILTCIDTYILRDSTTGVEIEKNLKSVWWIGYKF
jgi:hypothetical protein